MKKSKKMGLPEGRKVHVYDEFADALMCGKKKGTWAGPLGIQKVDVMCHKCATILLSEKNRLADRSNMLAQQVREQSQTASLLARGADRMLGVIENLAVFDAIPVDTDPDALPSSSEVTIADPEADDLVADLGAALREMRMPTPERRLAEVVEGLQDAGWVIQRAGV